MKTFKQAQTEAMEGSKKSVHPQYVVVDGNGFEVENKFSLDPSQEVLEVYTKGKLTKSNKPKSGATPQAEPEEQKQPEEQKTEVRTKNQKTKVMKKDKKQAAKKVAEKVAAKKVEPKKAAKKVEPKKAAKKTQEFSSAVMRPIVGGAAATILAMIQKKPHTIEELAKVAKVKASNIPWYLSKLKNNGHNVERTEKGYKVTK